MLAATIQALEVQRMTLSTLKSMNVQMGELGESLKIKPAARKVEAAAPSLTPSSAATKPAATKTPAAAVDPMQWWGALTNQFAELATSAMKDSAADAAKALAGNLMKQSFDAAADTMKKVAGAPGRAVAGAAKSLAPKAPGEAPAKKAAKRPASTKRRRAAPAAT